MSLATDLAAFYADMAAEGFALLAIFGIETAPLLLDQSDEDLVGGAAIGRAYLARMQTAHFPTLKRGDRLMIQNLEYLVREIHQIGDGLEKHLSLSRV